MAKGNGKKPAIQAKGRNDKGQFMPGVSGNPTGMRPGTTSVKTAIVNSFYEFKYNNRQGLAAFILWGQENPKEYYRILASLLPKDLNISTDMVAAEFGRMVREVMPDQADEIAQKLEDAFAARH